MKGKLVGVLVAGVGTALIVIGAVVTQEIKRIRPPESLSGILEDSGSITEYIYDEDLQTCFIRQGRQGQQLKTLTYVPCSEAFRARAAN